MQCKERLEVYLREHQVPFQLQHHAQAFSAQKIAESEHIPGKMVAKTVIVLADNNMVALVLPASYRADLNKIQAALPFPESFTHLLASFLLFHIYRKRLHA